MTGGENPLSFPLECFFGQDLSMDASHAALCLSGVVIGWWVSASKPQRVEPNVCHCQCAWAAGTEPHSRDSFSFWLVLLCGLLIVGTNLALVFRVTYQQAEGGSKEITFSVKGKPGKGIFGAQKGVQLLEQ